jgi:hypothetical protein
MPAIPLQEKRTFRSLSAEGAERRSGASADDEIAGGQVTAGAREKLSNLRLGDYFRWAIASVALDAAILVANPRAHCDIDVEARDRKLPRKPKLRPF